MAPLTLTPPPVPPVAAAARSAWAALEPIHNLLYFDTTADPYFVNLGVTDRRLTYFAARASALGAVGPELVRAVFYNFSPTGVALAIPRVWESASPETFVELRFTVADACIRPLLGDMVDSPQLHEALDLAKTAALNASQHMQGRPLFAAHAAIEWPQQPHVQLWWAQTLLREFRGDGHQTTLLHAGLSGIEALIMFVATEKVDGDALRLTRGWHSAEWRAAIASLQERGLLTSSPILEATDEGQQVRAWIENTTDILALPAYSVLGEAGCLRLAELSTFLNEPIVAADVIPWLKKRRAVSRRSRLRAVNSKAS
jgi:hypothetical protein